MNKDINAIGMVRQMVADGQISQEVAEKYFPELKESEGEKTKRMLHTIANKMSQHLRDIFTEEEYQCFDAWSNAWLEKQGEQKPAEWSEEDAEEANYIADFIENLIKKEKLVSKKTMAMEEMVTWLRGIKYRYFSYQTQDWSKEDKNALKVVTDVFEQYGVHLLNYPAFVYWIKTLPERISFNTYWKPSDEQMNALESIFAKHGAYDDDLLSLISDLKKLREE